MILTHARDPAFLAEIMRVQRPYVAKLLINAIRESDWLRRRDFQMV